MSCSYPETILRGVSDPNVIDSEGNPSSSLFPFDKDANADGNIEESINWNDDEGSKSYLFNKRKENGAIQFKVGVVTLSKSQIDQIMKLAQIKQRLSYERSIIFDNPYHGNVLIKSDVPKNLKKTIAASISLNAFVCFEKNNCQ